MTVDRPMPTLTRRRTDDTKLEGYAVYYGDVRVGHIGVQTGLPATADQWTWSCGFYPVDQRGVFAGGSAPDFEQARAAFQRAWEEKMLPQCTEADFLVNRRHRAGTAWKYKMWETCCKLPTQTTDGRSKCYCGAEITIATIDEHVNTHHIHEATA
jgi:hypothetical protein